MFESIVGALTGQPPSPTTLSVATQFIDDLVSNSSTDLVSVHHRPQVSIRGFVVTCVNTYYIGQHFTSGSGSDWGHC